LTAAKKPNSNLIQQEGEKKWGSATREKLKTITSLSQIASSKDRKVAAQMK
jgi:hypothetical protein